MNMDPHTVQASGVSSVMLNSGVIDLRGRYSKVMNMLTLDISQPLPVVSPTVSETRCYMQFPSSFYQSNDAYVTASILGCGKRDSCSGQLTLIGNVRFIVFESRVRIYFRIRRECF